MAISTQIEDGAGGTTKCVRVTKYGQLVTAPINYSSIASNKLELDDTAYNFVAPRFKEEIVITEILLYANKNVGVNDATVTIYTSDVGPSETTVKETILETEMLKQTARDLTGLNILVAEGRWINAKTDDDDVFCQIGYYYVPVVEG